MTKAEELLIVCGIACFSGHCHPNNIALLAYIRSLEDGILSGGAKDGCEFLEYGDAYCVFCRNDAPESGNVAHSEFCIYAQIRAEREG